MPCILLISSANWHTFTCIFPQSLSKNEDNHKAAFRKGKAQAELGLNEKAEKTLEDLLKRNPAGNFLSKFGSVGADIDTERDADAAAIHVELRRIKALDAARQRKHDQELRGMSWYSLITFSFPFSCRLFFLYLHFSIRFVPRISSSLSPIK